MASPNLIDVLKVSDTPMKKKKVIKADKAGKKVEKLTKKEDKKVRSASDVRKAMYGSKE